MTFKEARATNFQTVFGKTGHFSEDVTYRPAAGGAARTVTGPCVIEKLDDEFTAAGEDEREQLWFQCARDPAGDRGGIDRPELGDSIIRATDPPDSPWTYQGKTQNETDHSWQLLFARNRPRRYGPRS